jgi:hypothetical protein
LVGQGVGLLSTLATVVLFVIPSFSENVPRWWALLPLSAYIIFALLWNEYERVSSPCLSARVIRRQDQRHGITYLVIHNCGPVRVEQIEWDLIDAVGWELMMGDLEYPVSKLEPGEEESVYLVTVMGASSHAKILLRGIAEATPFKQDRRLTLYG